MALHSQVVPRNIQTVHQCNSLSRYEVIRAIAMAVEVDEEVFVGRVDKNFWSLRIIGYEARNEMTESLKVSGIREHTGELFSPC